MTITDRLTTAQANQAAIERQIDAYTAEIQRLTPQLWAVRGQVALLIELSQEEERDAEPSN